MDFAQKISSKPKKKVNGQAERKKKRKTNTLKKTFANELICMVIY